MWPPRTRLRIVINILTNHVINDSRRVDSSDFLIDQPFPIDKWINRWHKLRSKYFLSLTESVITFFKANFKKSINHLTWARSFPFEQLFSWSIFIILASFKKITQKIWKINYFFAWSEFPSIFRNFKFQLDHLPEDYLKSVC